MNTILTRLYDDEAGFIVSAELVLVATIVVLGMIVGLSEVGYNINEELEDVGTAFGRINQSYRYASVHGHKGEMSGSEYIDEADYCDSENDVSCDLGWSNER